ncbi:hypothetical protein EC957_012285 [Mortierella hygrophila]|uniref:Uncharacterized protein n=1 Tax=Mortierella hygrophila TaxID=979708 RepID=A0A9P6F898_9FUNG|nr:hypothetical protein EC957_012285 [Mortierella hygrophila]
MDTQEQNKEAYTNDNNGVSSRSTVVAIDSLAMTAIPHESTLQSSKAASVEDATALPADSPLSTAAPIDVSTQQSRPLEGQVEEETSHAPTQSAAFAISPISSLSPSTSQLPLPPSTLQLSLPPEGYTNIPNDHPIVRGNNPSPSPIPDTTQTTPASLSPGPGLTLRSRLRPLSVIIDLTSSPAGPSEPPAYVEQYQLQTMTSSSYETRPSSSLSTRQQLQHQHQHRGSLSFTPEPIVTSITGTSGPGAGTGAESQLSPSTPIPVSASINLSLSGYRRPFLEEDELPDYISLTETNLPFTLPSARSITYKVSVTQGPAEFQQPQQGSQQDASSSPLSPIPHEPILGHQRSTSEAGPSTAVIVQDVAIPNTPGDEAEPNHIQGGMDQEVSRRPGAWTMEYWVGDTILYLCYLMDPKMSAITELIPRNRSANTTTPSRIPNPFILAGSSRPFAATNTDADPITTMTTQDIGQPPIAVSVDIPQTIPQDITAAGTGTGTESNDGNDSENEEMERVPTGHIRGGPPPISRTRYNTTRPFVIPQLTASSLTVTRRRVTMPIPPRNSVTPASTAVPNDATTEEHTTTEEQGASGSTSVSAAGAEGSGPQEAVSPVTTPASSSVADQSTSAPAQDANFNANEPVAESPATAAGPLPAVRHIRINDGYPGEEADAILAHSMARMGVPGDRSNSQGHAYNNALTSEFYKVPSFAFVSAEDPQTWVWWSTHHENNLQRCRQEGPNEEVMMWWRTRFDDDATESKERRKQHKKERRMGLRPSENKTLKERWRRFWSLKSSVPYRESMEVTMRVRGLYYAWREESYTGDEEMNDIQILTSSPPRFFRLVRDDSLVMGQRVKGGPVAEVVIHGSSDAGPLAAAAGRGDALGGGAPSHFVGGGESTHMTETLDAPPYGPIPSIRSDGSSITSNNGNTFMTQVSAATGGPVRSTVASTYIQRVSHGRRSGASSMRYHFSDPETPAPTIGDERRHSLAPSEPASSRFSPLASSPDADPDQPSSFSFSLRKRTCTIRILEGINSEVETFALSTGPRLPELFDLFTDESVPGPSRATFIFSIVVFSLGFLVVFLSIALTSKH